MAPVVLNIYDLAPQNNWTYWCGVGIFHSGVEVYGVEYAYGGAYGESVKGLCVLGEGFQEAYPMAS